MSREPSRAFHLGIGLFILLAGAVAWRYNGVEGPHALALVAALAGWLGLFSAAALGVGAPLWRWASGEPLGSSASWSVAATAGAAGLAAIAGALGSVGLLRPLVLLVVLLVAATSGLIALARSGPAAPPRPPPVPALVLAFVAVATFLAVATPSPFYDQVHYHLAFPERWLRSGTIEVFPRHSYSYLAANMGLLYCYGLAGPGIWAAQALHWWTGLVAALAAFGIARSIGAGPAGAFWAAAFVAATPSFLLSSTWAASDLGVAAFGAAGCLMVLAATGGGPRRGPAWYTLAGLLGGAAFGCKYVGATAAIVPAGLILAGALAADWRARAGAAAGIQRLLAWGAGVVVALLPWAARNAWLTGNPIHPFLPGLFARFVPAGEVETAARAAAGIAGEAHAGGEWLAALSLRTFDAVGAAGWIGPLWITLLPLWAARLLFGRRSPRSVLLALGVLAGIFGWTRFHQLGRYLLPVLVLAAAGIGAAWEQVLAATGGMLRRAILALVTFLLLWSVQGGLSEELFTRVACTFGRSDPRRLLERYVTYWPALPIVNEQLPEDARLLLVGEPRAFRLERDVVVEDPFREPYLVELAEQSASGPEIAATLRRRGITHLLVNQAEAARIGKLRRVDAYFADAGPQELERLGAFFDGCLELVGEAGAVRVSRVAEVCRPVPPPAR